MQNIFEVKLPWGITNSLIQEESAYVMLINTFFLYFHGHGLVNVQVTWDLVHVYRLQVIGQSEQLLINDNKIKSLGKF